MRDGAETLDWLCARGAYAGRDATVLPQLLLLDLMLPNVDGLEVLEAARADPRIRGVPIVLLTSSKEDRDVARDYDLGVNSYVCKPVDFAQFAESIRELGSYWLIVNEPPPA